MKLSIKIFICTFAAVGVVATGAFALGQEKEAQEKNVPRTAPTSKISPVRAMKVAEGKTGGKAAIATFEFEDGHWIYGVVVAKNHKLMEVEIDAMTGKVGDTEAITPEAEAKEFSQELAKFAKSSR